MPGQAMQCNHTGACVTPVTDLVTMQHFGSKKNAVCKFGESGLLRSGVWQVFL